MPGETIVVATDFSRFPGGRYRTDGPHSGQEFREDHLVPALTGHRYVTVVLDNVVGLPPSFLEEAFGGLVREGLSEDDLKERLRVVANSTRLSPYPDLVWDYIHKASRALNRAS